MGGTKHDQDKLRTDLLPVYVLEGIARVFTWGAKGYGDWNWRKGIKLSRLYGATLRHVFAFWKGEDLDPESGLPHLDHALCSIIMLRENYRLRKDMDDRIEKIELTDEPGIVVLFDEATEREKMSAWKVSDISDRNRSWFRKAFEDEAARKKAQRDMVTKLMDRVHVLDKRTGEKIYEILEDELRECGERDPLTKEELVE